MPSQWHELPCCSPVYCSTIQVERSRIPQTIYIYEWTMCVAYVGQIMVWIIASHFHCLDLCREDAFLMCTRYDLAQVCREGAVQSPWSRNNVPGFDLCYTDPAPYQVYNNGRFGSRWSRSWSIWSICPMRKKTSDADWSGDAWQLRAVEYHCTWYVYTLVSSGLLPHVWIII